MLESQITLLGNELLHTAEVKINISLVLEDWLIDLHVCSLELFITSIFCA